MNKQLRNGGDYIAVDLVDEKGRIQSTPIYLTKNKPKLLKWLDRDERRYIASYVTFDGSKLLCSDAGEEDAWRWESPIDELLTEVKV
jgi:hypothetical protein